MAQKTHLTKQEELVTERGIQMRTTDPISPVLDQLWVNKTSNALKYFDGSSIQTIVGGVPGPINSIDDERAWGGLIQELSDAEISAYNRQPSPLAIIDTMGKSEGVLTNLVKSGSTLTWASGQNTGTYVRDREVTTLINKVTGVVVATIRALAPKAVAITPTTSDTAPVVTFYGNVTQYFPIGKPVMIFKNTITDNIRIHRHLLYQGKIALLNVTAASYNSGNDTTQVTIDNPNGLDISLSIAQANYTAQLRLAPWDFKVEARAQLLGAYDECTLKTGFCEGSIRMFGQQLMQVFSPANTLNSHWYHNVKFSPSKQYGVLKITEVFNVGSSDRLRMHWWWTANSGQTWTKFTYFYEMPNVYGMYSQPDLWGSAHPGGQNPILVADNGKAVMIFGIGHTSNGQINFAGYYANISDPTPAMTALPYDNGGGAGTLWWNTSYGGYNWGMDGPKDNLDAFGITMFWYVSGCDQRQRIWYFTWSGVSPVFQWQYADWGNNSPDQIYNFVCYRKPSNPAQHVIWMNRYICSTGARDYAYWDADVSGSTFLNVDSGSQSNDNRPYWFKETTNYVVFCHMRVSGNPLEIFYFHKNNPQNLIRVTDGYGHIGTWYSGTGTNYGSNSSGNWASEVGHLQETMDRVLVDPTNEKRIIFPVFLYDGQYRRHWLMELEDFTNQAFPVEYNQADNDWWYLADNGTRTQLGQVFQWNSSRPLRSAILKLYKNSTGYTPDRGENFLTLEIQQVTGGATGYPNGTVVATSTLTLDASLINYEHTPSNWRIFPFNPGLSLVSGNYYALVLKQTAAVGYDSNRFMAWRSYTGNNYSRGHAVQYNGSAWSDLGGNSSNDFCFILSPNFMQELDMEFTYEGGKQGNYGEFDGHSLMCQTGPYEMEWAYRLKRSHNDNAFTLGGHIWRRKISMNASPSNLFTMSDRKPLGYKGEGIDYDANLMFNWAIGDPASLRKYRTGTIDNGRYTEENGNLGLIWNTWGGNEPGGLRVADSEFQLGYAYDCGSGNNCLRWQGDGSAQHETWNFDYRGHLWAVEAEIKPYNAALNNDTYICATHGSGSGWIFRFVNGYLAFYNSSFGNVSIASDQIGPNVYHKVRVIKNYVTKKYHLFRKVPPSNVWVEVASYSIQAINVANSGSDSYFSVGGDTAISGGNRFSGRIGYVKAMHGPVKPYMNYNAGTGFYEPFAYEGYKNQSPLNRQRPMFVDSNGNAKWMALRFPYRKDNNSWAPEVVEIGADNLSVVDSFDQILTYEKIGLTPAGQEPGIKLTMNRNGSHNANSLRGMAFEFNGD